MSAEDFKKYSPTDPELIDKIVNNIKAQGLFDQFRKDCLADVDTKPAYQNLKQRVNGSVTGFLSSQKWQGTLNKTQLRESLRKHTVQQGFLEVGVDRIVDQVVNPKIYSIFTPKVEDVVYECLGIEKPKPKPKPLLLDFQAFKKSLTPMNSVASKPEKTEKIHVPSVSKEEELPEVKKEPQEPLKEIEHLPITEKPSEPTNTPPPLDSIDTSEPLQDLGPGTPPSVPDVNNVNNDDDSNTIDEMPLIAASLDQDSNRATTPILNSLPHPNNIKMSALSEASGSQSMVVTRARSEYDSSTNNLSLKSEEKISPSKKFDNFSNLGEKLKQSDMNLRETSASKNEIVTEESSELTKSSENDSESYETKVDPPSESNLSSLDNARYEPIKDEDIYADKMFSEDSYSSLMSSKSRSRIDEVKESKSREKHTEKKSSSSKLKDKSKSSGDRDGSVGRDLDDKKDRHKGSKVGEFKPKDEGKGKSKNDKDAKHKSDKHKSSKEKISHSSDRHSKNDLEKERKEKRDRAEIDDKKADKCKQDSKVSENGKDSEKKRKDDDKSHSKSHEKNDRKYDDKAKSEKEKKDKGKSEGKSKNDSSSKSQSKSNDKKSKDEKKGKDEESRKESKKRKREQCDEDDLKSRNSRRSSDRDSNGNPDGGSNKPKSSSSSHSSRKSSKADKERKHSKKESNPSDAVEELCNEELVTDEIDLIMMQINNSIEDEQQRLNVRELLGEPNVKKPKIASNFQEIKKVMQARKHIDRIISEVNVEHLIDDGSDEEHWSPLSSDDGRPINEDPHEDGKEGVEMKKFSLVLKDVLKNSENNCVPSLKNKCLKLEGKYADNLATGVSLILGEDDEILRVNQNESGTSESGTSACEQKECALAVSEKIMDPTFESVVVGKDGVKILADRGDLSGVGHDGGIKAEVHHSQKESGLSESEELMDQERADTASSGAVKLLGSHVSQTKSRTLKSECSKDGQEESAGSSAGNITQIAKSSVSRNTGAKTKSPESEAMADKENADSSDPEDSCLELKPSNSLNRQHKNRTVSEGSKNEDAESVGNDIRIAQPSLPNSLVPCRSSSRKNAGNRLHAILEEVGGIKYPTSTAERSKRKVPKDGETDDDSHVGKSCKGAEQVGLVDQSNAKINPDDGSDVSNKENDEAKASGACKKNHQKTEEVLPDVPQVEPRSLRRKPVDSTGLHMNEDISKLSAPITRPTTRRSAVTPLNLRNKELDDDALRSKTLPVMTPGSPELESSSVADKFRINEGVRKSVECLQMDKENTLTTLSLEKASAAQARNIASPTQRRKSCPDIFQRRGSHDHKEPPSSGDESNQSSSFECMAIEKSGDKVGLINRSDKLSDSNLVEESNEAPKGLGCSMKKSVSMVDGPKLDGLRSGKKPKHGISSGSGPCGTPKLSLGKNPSKLVATKMKEPNKVAGGNVDIPGSYSPDGRSEDTTLSTVKGSESLKGKPEDEGLIVHFEYRTRGVNKRRKLMVDEKKKSDYSMAQKNSKGAAVFPVTSEGSNRRPPESPSGLINSLSSSNRDPNSQPDDKANTVDRAGAPTRESSDSVDVKGRMGGRKNKRKVPGRQGSKNGEECSVEDETATQPANQLSSGKNSGVDHLSTVLDRGQSQVSAEPRSSSVDSMMCEFESVSELRGFSEEEFDEESGDDCRGFSEEQIQKAVFQLRLLKNFISHSSLAQQPRPADVGKPRPKRTRVSSEVAPPPSADPPNAPRTSTRIPRKRKFSLNTSPDKEKKNDLGQCKAESKDSGLCESPEQPSFTSNVAQKVSATERPPYENNGLRSRKMQGVMVNGDSSKSSKQCNEKAKGEGITSMKKTLTSTRSSQRYNASDLYKPRPSFTRDSKTTPSPRVTTVGRSKKST